MGQICSGKKEEKRKSRVQEMSDGAEICKHVEEPVKHNCGVKSIGAAATIRWYPKRHVMLKNILTGLSDL